MLTTGSILKIRSGGFFSHQALISFSHCFWFLRKMSCTCLWKVQLFTKLASLVCWFLSGIVSVNFSGFVLFKNLIHKDVMKIHCWRKILYKLQNCVLSLIFHSF